MEGQRKTSDLFTLRGRSWSSDPAKARQQAEAYPPGTRTTCLVNPDNPDIAVLKPDSLAPGYSIWFPGLFVLAGSVISLRALRKPDKSTLRSAH